MENTIIIQNAEVLLLVSMMYLSFVRERYRVSESPTDPSASSSSFASSALHAPEPDFDTDGYSVGNPELLLADFLASLTTLTPPVLPAGVDNVALHIRTSPELLSHYMSRTALLTGLRREVRFVPHDAVLRLHGPSVDIRNHLLRFGRPLAQLRQSATRRRTQHPACELSFLVWTADASALIGVHGQHIQQLRRSFPGSIIVNNDCLPDSSERMVHLIAAWDELVTFAMAHLPSRTPSGRWYLP